MSVWNSETGFYTLPPTYDRPEDIDLTETREDDWLSKPGGEHYIGISFHFARFNYPIGHGTIGNRFKYRVSPFMLNIVQDCYNSWGVKACLNEFVDQSEFSHWEWLPGLLIIDTSMKYTLPDSSLAAFAGSEWADNDYRIFCGFKDIDIFLSLRKKLIEIVNKLTGPGWANWPYGERQLSEAVITWINPDINLPDVILLAAFRPNGLKFSWLGLDRRLYFPDSEFGGWGNPMPKNCWDHKETIRYFYQAKLLLRDGMTEMALIAAIEALKSATSKILLFLLNDNITRAEKELYNYEFLDRFDKLLPKYGIQLPNNLFEQLKQAFFERDGKIHSLRPLDSEKVEIHLKTIQEIIVWYWEKVGDGANNSNEKLIDSQIPF